MARLIPQELLKEVKGITYSKPHLWRLERAGLFPRRVRMGAGRVGGYIESELDAWLAARIAERDDIVVLQPLQMGFSRRLAKTAGRGSEARRDADLLG